MGSSGAAGGADGDATLPALVPDHQRYVCGWPGCLHLTGSEALLKYHLQTLHKEAAAVVACPHCPPAAASADPTLTRMSLDAYRAHLKLHGPVRTRAVFNLSFQSTLPLSNTIADELKCVVNVMRIGKM